MTKFLLPEAYNVNGKKLANKIRKDKHIKASPELFDVTFIPPRTVEIVGVDPEDEDLVAQIVASHTPRTSYWQRIKRMFSQRP